MVELYKPFRSFIWFSIAIAALHFVWETLFHIQWGQFLPMLIVDYIAISLLLLGSIGFWKWGWGVPDCYVGLGASSSASTIEPFLSELTRLWKVQLTRQRPLLLKADVRPDWQVGDRRFRSPYPSSAILTFAQLLVSLPSPTFAE